MADDIYYRLRDLLDTIPSGFPSTPDGVEIRILKKIFSEEEAEITTKLMMRYETAQTIAGRAGMDAEYLEGKLWKCRARARSGA